MMTRILTVALLIMVAWLAGCGGDPGNAGAGNGTAAKDTRDKIVCTTGMVADIVRQVVGERYNVIGLMGEGVDPHLYKPTTSDSAKMQDAAVIFYSGLLLEGPLQKPLETLAGSKPVFAVTETIPQDRLRTPPEFEGHPDPHVWMDVSLWMMAVEAVTKRMSEIDPERADTYRTNADAYLAELTKLHDYATETIATIPEAQRYLVTAHDAFSYFSSAYGIPVESVQGITTESEPGVNDVIRLVDLLVTKEIPALFVESSVNEGNLRAVIESAAERGWTVEEGGTLYSDAMGPTGTYTGTYIGMIDHNVTTIANALGGQAPAKGLNDEL